MITRRQFLGLTTVAAAGGLAALARLENTTSNIERVVRPVALARLPQEFEDYRIGFLSDVHLSPALPEQWLITALEMLHEEKVDLLALGGDYLWIPETSSSRLYGKERNPKYSYSGGIKMAPTIYQDFAAYVSPFIPRDGAVAVYGNHDRWYDPQACRKALQEGGSELLINQEKVISRGDARLVVFGVDDYWTGFPSLKPLPPRQKNELRVILSHNPDFLSVVHRNRWDHFDLGLCGHTHGGQICLPLIGAPFYNIRDGRLAAGLARLGNKWIYTSRGLGMVEFPHRINCRPEVTVLELKRA